MSKVLRDRLGVSLKDVHINHKAAVLLAYALGYINDEAFRFLTGLGDLGMDKECLD